MSTTTTPAAAALEIAFRAMPKPRTWDVEAMGLARCPVAMRMSGAELRSAAGLPAQVKAPRKARQAKPATPKAPQPTGVGAKGGALAVIRAAARIRATEAYKAGAPISQAEACEAFGVTPSGVSPAPRQAQIDRAKAILAEANVQVAPGI